MKNPFKAFWAWLEPPGPRELGRSDSDALPSALFGSDGTENYTWEDWAVEVKEKYPVRYWITHTFQYAVVFPIQRKWTDFWDWVKCHTMPSKRYHLLDLRNPGPGIDYTHGWTDQVQVITWACFVSLRNFVEKEHPVAPRSRFTAEEFEAEPVFQESQARHEEIMALYDWWMRGRVEEKAEEERLFSVTKELRRGTPEHRTAIDTWIAYHRWREDVRDNEMLHRLINVRQYLWT